MNVLPLQQGLRAKGYDCGALDGVLGPVTFAMLVAYTAGLRVDPAIPPALLQAFRDAGITRSRLQMLHALAQAATETAEFTAMVERGGSTYFARYDGRYGNRAGEGYLYRGRGFVMLTFHDNYAAAGEALGLDLVDHPNQAAEPATAARIFAWYWTSRHVGAYADIDDLEAVTRKINGGLTGLDDRRAHLARLKAVWPA